MNKENCALKLVDEIILYYDARSKKHKKMNFCVISFMYPYKQSGRWQDVPDHKGFNSKSLTILAVTSYYFQKAPAGSPGAPE